MRAYALIIKIHCVNDLIGTFINFVVSPVCKLDNLYKNINLACRLVPRLLRTLIFISQASAIFKLISRRLPFELLQLFSWASIFICRRHWRH